MTADTIGGVWTYALELCRSLAAYDIEVHLATMGRALSESQWEEAEEIANLRIYESEFRLEWMDNPWEDVEAAGQWLLSLENQINPDIIHLNNYAHGNLPWTTPVVVVAHSCVLSWWEAVKKEAAPTAWNEYRERVKAGLQAANVVVAISHSYGQVLRRLYGPFKSEVIVYNGCKASDFRSVVKKNAAFAMGRIWDEAKNLRLLEKIAGKSRYPIAIAGDQRHPVNQKTLDLQHVTLPGQLSRQEVKTALAESLIYILPAKYEPFGLSALEAAFSGCLLVLADIPTLREIWQDSALYFNPENPDSLLNQLQWIHEHPDRRKELVMKSTRRAAYFSSERMGKNYVNIYQSLMASVEKAGAIL